MINNNSLILILKNLGYKDLYNIFNIIFYGNRQKIIQAYALKNAIDHEGKAVVGSVIPGLFNHGLTKEKIKDVMKDVNEVIKEVNSWDIEKQKTEFENILI